MSKTTAMIMAFAGLVALLAAPAVAAPAAIFGPSPDETRIEEVTRIVMPSVVMVEVGPKGKKGIRKIATGVVIDKDGSIATTALISPRDEAITIATANGKVIEAEFVGMDPETRLAVVRAKDKGLTPLVLADSAKLVPGAWIGVVSFSPENTPSVTQGIVSSISAERLRLNVWVVPGSSGSPVVNAQGQMVGLLRGSYADTLPLVFQFQEKDVVGSGYAWSQGEAAASGMAMAIPSDVVKSITDEIRAKGKVERGWMGVTIADNEDSRTEIVQIEKKSPADLADLEKGDIVLSMDGKDVKGSQSLASEIRKRKPGQEVALKVERDGKTIEVKIKLAEYPEHEARLELERAFPRLFTPEGETKGLALPRAKTLPALGYAFSLEKRKYLGVFLNELTPELSEYFGLKDGTGLLVTKFAEKSPAQEAGLKVGDVVFKVDGVRVDAVAKLSEIIQDKKKGDKVKVEFLRDKKASSIDIPVGEEERSSLFESSSSLARDLLESYSAPPTRRETAFSRTRSVFWI
ncbi:MAG: PDZ domain-containing protein [Candidatus Aminicenantes bacterium]|nr:PDZ domain-containing protein [Candidatus Aminicenantes bacterium]